MLDLLIAFPLLSLATYRVWRIFAVDSITEPLRARFLFREGRVWEWVADLVTCPWCLGWWLSGAAVAAYVGWSGASWWLFPVGWCAVSAGVGITHHLVDNLSSNE